MEVSGWKEEKPLETGFLCTANVPHATILDLVRPRSITTPQGFPLRLLFASRARCERPYHLTVPLPRPLIDDRAPTLDPRHRSLDPRILLLWSMIFFFFFFLRGETDFFKKTNDSMKWWIDQDEIEWWDRSMKF